MDNQKKTPETGSGRSQDDVSLPAPPPEAGPQAYAQWLALRGQGPGDAPDLMRHCCAGSLLGGISACTCWEPEFDRPQRASLPMDEQRISNRPQPCGRCYYRDGADPETRELLAIMAESSRTLFCPDGQRRIARWHHRAAGITVAGNLDEYFPAFVSGVPLRADGTVSAVCAGWATASRTARVRRIAGAR
jgi:hypothetical protein